MMNRNNQKAKHAFNSKNVIRIFSVIRKGVRNGVCEDGHLRICAMRPVQVNFQGKEEYVSVQKRADSLARLWQWDNSGETFERNRHDLLFALHLILWNYNICGKSVI